jgi:hypothetical protein
MKPSILPAVAAVALIAGCTSQSQTGTKDASLTSIPYIRDINTWQPDGTKGLYIQLDNKQWYYATFQAPCIDLPYAMGIGFRTQPPLSLDKFDSIVVQGRTCFFKSLDPSSGPGRPDTAVQPKPTAPAPGQV